MFIVCWTCSGLKDSQLFHLTTFSFKPCNRKRDSSLKIPFFSRQKSMIYSFCPMSKFFIILVLFFFRWSSCLPVNFRKPVQYSLITNIKNIINKSIWKSELLFDGFILLFLIKNCMGSIYRFLPHFPLLLREDVQDPLYLVRIFIGFICLHQLQKR